MPRGTKRNYNGEAAPKVGGQNNLRKFDQAVGKEEPVAMSANKDGPVRRTSKRVIKVKKKGFCLTR